MKCPQCQVEVSQSRVTCDKCLYHLGYPNVRFAAQAVYVKALETRFAATLQKLEDQGLKDAAQNVQDLVAQRSTAVLARWSSLIEDLEKDRGFFLTFYQQVSANRRSPQDNGWDTKRKAVDAALFPYYEEQVSFLCLSLNDRGVEYYGDFHFSFSIRSICHRTTVCQENSVVFCETHKTTIINPDLRGFVASWDDRSKLALCKLQDAVQHGQTVEDIQALLIQDDPQNRKGYEDFIECHVYGLPHVLNSREITYRPATRKEDRAAQKRAVRLLKGLGLNPVRIQ